MPGQTIDKPNPAAAPSHLPEAIDDLRVRLDKATLDDDARSSLNKFRRAANYIAAGQLCRSNLPEPNHNRRTITDLWKAMIFLQDNAYLKRPLKSEDIKPRLLGTL